jgi:hypothetical protein
VTGFVNSILHLGKSAHGCLVFSVKGIVIVEGRLVLYTQVKKLLSHILKLVSDKLGLGWAWRRSLF